MATSATLPKRARVTAKRDFDVARSEGRSYSDAVLRVTARKNGLTTTRLGLAVAKRGSAVKRNRIKRVLREAFRHARQTLPPGYDLIVSPRDHEKASDLGCVTRSLTALAARATKASSGARP